MSAIDGFNEREHGRMFLICHVCRPPSAKMLALAQHVVDAQAARDRMLAAMTAEDREAYWEQWAHRLANQLAQFTD